MKILITGGAGYIGSHTAVDLLNEGHEVIIIDNLCNSDKMAVHAIEEITKTKIEFHNTDITDEKELRKTVRKINNIDCVIHFAAFKSVKEGEELPIKYYHNNVSGMLILLKVLYEYGIEKIIFSSSCTVYGQPDKIPVDESAPVSKPQNIYGHTKIICEGILESTAQRNNLGVVSLRYFNPIGAHSSLLLGENPTGAPQNLIPVLNEVLLGKRKYLSIYGSDYPTRDGTAVRDYIHVMDLASAHKKAAEFITNSDGGTYRVFNIGTGRGYTVKEILDLYKCVNSVSLNYKYVERRAGDIAKIYANPELAKREIGWESKRSIETALKSAWLWAKHKSKNK